jgi:hypothetical protein
MVVTQKLGATLIDPSEAVDLTVLVNRVLRQIDPELVTVNHQGVPALAAPVLAAAVPGGSSVTYYVVARDSYGTGPDGIAGRRALASLTATVTSAGPLSGTNNITISGTLPAQHNYQTIQIVRSSGGSSQGVIGTVTVTGLTSYAFTDTGLSATVYTTPVRNETADLLVGGYLGVGNINPIRQLHVTGGARFESGGNGIEHVAYDANNWQIQPVGAITNLNYLLNLSVSGSLNVTGATTITTLNASNATLNGTITLGAAAVLDTTGSGALRVPVNATTLTLTGGVRLHTGDNTLRYRDGTTERSLVDLTLAQNLSNKTLATPIVTGANPISGGALGYSGGTLQFGDGSATRTVVSLDQAQSLSNKTLNNALLNGTTAISGAIGGAANVNMSGFIQASFDGAGVATNAGDLGARRAANVGILYLGNTTHYLYFDGANYTLPSGNLYVNGAIVPTVSNGQPFTSGPFTNDWLRINANGNGIYSTVAGTGFTFSSGDAGPKIYGGTFSSELVQSRARHDTYHRVGTGGNVTIDMGSYDGYAFNTGSYVYLPPITSYYGRTIFVKNMTGALANAYVSDGNGIYDTTWRNPFPLNQGDSITLFASPQYTGWLVI